MGVDDDDGEKEKEARLAKNKPGKTKQPRVSFATTEEGSDDGDEEEDSHSDSNSDDDVTETQPRK